MFNILTKLCRKEQELQLISCCFLLGKLNQLVRITEHIISYIVWAIVLTDESHLSFNFFYFIARYIFGQKMVVLKIFLFTTLLIFKFFCFCFYDYFLFAKYLRFDNCNDSHFVKISNLASMSIEQVYEKLVKF